LKAVSAAVNYEGREPDAALAPLTPQRTANMSFFPTHDLPAVRRYHVDIAALAAKLDKAQVEFPGDHSGWLLHPKSFASTAQRDPRLSLETVRW
jgi:hypothetical protein